MGRTPPKGVGLQRSEEKDVVAQPKKAGERPRGQEVAPPSIPPQTIRGKVVK